MLTLPNVNPLSCGALSGITMGGPLEVKRNGETMVERGDNRWENRGGDLGVSKEHILLR